ncbi:MAG: DISARM system helicase DrmA [Bryobacterales bacterium]|nr:DISARM system helicase DrmA [Bryobacterales bacterium]
MSKRLPESGSSQPGSSVEIRDQLADALHLDLVGPWAGHALELERIPNYSGRVRPSTWYLTGFLIPPDSVVPAVEMDAVSEDLDETLENSGTAEESGDDGKPTRRGYFPSSMGLSFLVDARARQLSVTVRWGDYAQEEAEDKRVWSRIPREEPLVVRILDTDTLVEQEIPRSRGLFLRISAKPILAEPHRAPNTPLRSVSVFLMNRRRGSVGHVLEADKFYVFQPEIEVRCDRPFPSRATAQADVSSDWDDFVADLHYADTPEYATGHGVSADWETVDGECRVVRTAWIGKASVEVTLTSAMSDMELSMAALGSLRSGSDAHAALAPLVDHYRRWIRAQADSLGSLEGRQRETAEELLRLAGIAADRIETGIDAVATDPDVLDAFRVANRAVGRALTQRLELPNPSWRPFQLAFILLNLPEIANPEDGHRETVDLLFFPTGGGKTEAYLGLAAMTMVLRRLRSPGSQGHAAGGVSVLMRYTLRLLTLDQLARASGLVCALELEREEDTSRYGNWPFEIGLWVGTAATPNWMGAKGDHMHGTARSKVNRFKSEPSSNPSPIPLEECPWCGAKFEPESFNLVPDSDKPVDLRVTCLNFDCSFNGERYLPIVAVDEPLYRRLPAFLVATVDKFASLPWTGPSGTLLGGADRYDENGFYGACDPRIGTLLEKPLLPPDLIIQDELHLISGPLGTMAGLYETAIESLCVRDSGPRPIRPKIVASTATVRRAKNQIQALFGRSLTQIFPPPGPDRRDSFFAQTVPASEKPARLYLGISAQGRSAKVVTRRVIVALMGAAMRAYLNAGGDRDESNPADPYMTVIGYFNSLRELGGGRRILEEEVQNTIKQIGRKRRHGESKGLFRDRLRFSRVVELTSRVSTDQVAVARGLLDNRFRMRDSMQKGTVDCAIATNMISVGLDVQRLGLMTVIGQPKTAAEYIQATSRVGRDPARPGLVVTLLNIHKPRDRSHYERFRHFHETFYRSVEVASVTPFAARALDRGFAGALVALARHAADGLEPADGAGEIESLRAEIEPQLKEVFANRVRGQPISRGGGAEMDEMLRSVRNRIDDLLDAWQRISTDSLNSSGRFRYQQYEERGAGRFLLREMLDEGIEDELRKKFRANRSLRDVEPDVRMDLVSSLAGSDRNKSRIGTLRSSQVITTYGPGALVDLPKHSVIVAGLETWKPKRLRQIEEPRLAARVRSVTGIPAPRLYASPRDSKPTWFQTTSRQSRIGARRFPKWFVVQSADRPNVGNRSGSAVTSRRLVHLDDLEKDRFERKPVVATRFVRACRKGHVDDVDWRHFAHFGNTPCRRPLWLDERGQSGDLADLVVRCECGSQRSLSAAGDWNDNPLGKCSGKRPWLGRYADEDCNEVHRLLIRTATNAYFSQVVRVLSIPEQDTGIQDHIASQWGTFKEIESVEDLNAVARFIEAVRETRRSYSDVAILEAIQANKEGKSDDRPAKHVELDAFLKAKEGFGDDVPIDRDFHARTLPRSGWRDDPVCERIEAIVQVHRLREVSALVGFTRLEAGVPDIDGNYETDVRRAELAEDPTWVPATENRGEGVFLALRPDFVAAWIENPGVASRVESLRKGHGEWMRQRSAEGPEFPGGPYVLLHTLSHLLMQALTLRCGYPAASIRERIYLDLAARRYGLLLYTASPDAEGTLGGLVEQGRRIGEHLRMALEMGALCSSDPICAQHAPGDSPDDRWLHGAACHNCSLIAETSCEMRNEYLDRALVVPTVDVPDAAFFDRPL